MIRRQPKLCSIYIIAFGLLLALAATQPCFGSKGFVKLAKEEDQKLLSAKDLLTVTSSRQKIAQVRYLEDNEETGDQGVEEEEEEEEDDDDDDPEEEDVDHDKEEEGDGADGTTVEEEDVDTGTTVEEEDVDTPGDDDETTNGEVGGNTESVEETEATIDEEGATSGGGEVDDEVEEGDETAEEATTSTDNDDKEPEEDVSSKANEDEDKVGPTNSEKTSASPTGTPSVPKKNWESDYSEPAVATYIIGFLALIVLIAVYLKFCRSRVGGGIMSPSSQRPHGKYETVATDDVDGDGDEWGWDDQNNETDDIELAGSPSQQPQPIPSPSGLSLTHRSPSLEGRDVIKSANIARQKGLNLPQAQTPVQQSPTPPMNPPPTMITSLGTPTLPVAKKAPAHKPQEDDIFASMGLAAQPKFQTSRPAVRPASNSGWRAVAPAPSSAPLPSIPVPADSFGDGDDNWDNDLDDLFDD